MTTEADNPRRKPKVGASILRAVLLLIVMGAVGLFLLGRPLPQKAGARPLAWGDRVERRMDAFIDGVRPQWADRIEARLDAVTARFGWK